MENQILRDLNVSHETLKKLKIYQDLLLEWNQRINLISKNSEEICFERHILDSIQILKYIPNINIILLDAGSGAGLPGIILSICGIQNVILVDSNGKKAKFLQEAAKLSPNNIEIIHRRIEGLDINCDILTSRALANLDKIISLSKNIKINDKFLLFKGKTFQSEIDNAKLKWKFNYNSHISLTNNESRILEISSVTRK